MSTETAARHSCDSPDWYTPAPFVDASRVVMGGIDLDPASDEEAQRTVQATRFYTVEDDGLVQPWCGHIFVNPPGGLVREFWWKLMQSRDTPQFDQAIWIGYSLEQLQTLQGKGVDDPLGFPMCVPKRRIPFVENEAKRAARIEKLRAQGKSPNLKSQPSHANYITYIGPHVEVFCAVFSVFGSVRR